jgi:hypothetical protein
VSSSFNPYLIQIEQLEAQIQQDQTLLSELTERLRVVAADPLEARRLQLDCDHVRRLYDKHLAEWESLQQRPTVAASPAGQNIGSQLEKMGAQLTDVQQELQGLRGDVGSLRSDILARFDTHEQAVIAALVQRLDDEQLAITRAGLQAVESAPDVSELHPLLTTVTTELQALRRQIEAGSRPETQPLAAAMRVLEDPKLEFKHKLKVSLPLIPGILSYERELGLGTNANLRAAYDRLRDWVRARRPDTHPQ